MTNPALMIRPARPTPDEGRALARYVDEAAEGSFRILLGRHADGILAKMLVEPGHDYLFEHVLFAEDAAAIVGMADGFPRVPNRGMKHQPLLRASRPRGRVLRWAAAMGHPLFRIHSTLREGDFYLQFLGVEKAYRGRGIGSALIDSMEERARVAGSQRFAVDVWDRNRGAKRLYACRGMVARSCWPKRFVIPGFGLARMTKPL